MRRLWLPALLIALAAGAYLVFLYEQKPPVHPAPQVAQTVVAAEGKLEAVPGYDVNLGTGELNGKVAKILVQEGDAVTQGQLVAVLENDDLQARVKAAEQELAVAESRLREVEAGARKEEILQVAAALEGAAAALDEAQRQYVRYRDLRAQGMVAQAIVDERERAVRMAQSRVEELSQQKKLLEAGPRAETVKLYRDQVALARAGLEHSRRQLEKTNLRSPIAGRIIKRYLDEGEGVTPEIPILAIADLAQTWINAEVDETDVGSIGVGNAVTVTSDAYRGQVFKGRIVQIGDFAGQRTVTPGNPAVNLGLKVIQVKIELLEQTPLKLGMTVNVKITPGGP